MDAVYLGYFRLAATKLNDLGRAFTVVEQARGRALADLIASRDNIPTQQSAQLTEFDKRISALQMRLMIPGSRDERKQILEELLMTEFIPGSGSDREQPDLDGNADPANRCAAGRAQRRQFT
jgi:hypothetical protein